MNAASRERRPSIRLTMKPSQLPVTIGSLPMRLATACTVARVCGDAPAVRMTSTRRMTGAGLKKCRPQTSAGRPLTAASSSISRYDVLLASTLPGFVARPSSFEDGLLRRAILADGFADEIRVGKRRRVRGRLDVGESLPASASLGEPRNLARVGLANRRDGALKGGDGTRKPSPASRKPGNTCAMPRPIVPSPTMATRRTSRGDTSSRSGTRPTTRSDAKT